MAKFRTCSSLLFVLGCVGACGGDSDGVAAPVERIGSVCSEIDHADDGTVEQVWTYGHDADGFNTTGQQAPDGDAYVITYDADNFYTSYVYTFGAGGYEDLITYDDRHRVTTRVETDTFDPAETTVTTTAQAFDDQDRLTRLTTTNAVTVTDTSATTTTVTVATYAYAGDARDPISGTVDRDGELSTLEMTLSGDGRTLTIASYDAADVLTGTNVFVRDANRNVVRRETLDGAGTRTRLDELTYNSADDVLEASYTFSDFTYAFAYTYNDDRSYLTARSGYDGDVSLETYQAACELTPTATAKATRRTAPPPAIRARLHAPARSLTVTP